MKDEECSAAWKRLKALHEMSCNKELSFFGCKGCDYYYETEHRTIACLKEDIRRWTLYRVGFFDEN